MLDYKIYVFNIFYLGLLITNYTCELYDHSRLEASLAVWRHRRHHHAVIVADFHHHNDHYS